MKEAFKLVGVGFGPSNLALAVALDELESYACFPFTFLEKKATFHWHSEMLIDDAEMQVSFLKDLATLRNPMSPYTFVNYLYTAGRLAYFINLRNFYPSRIEFDDYFSWAAEKLKRHVKYNSHVISVTPSGAKPYNLLEVVYEDNNGNQNSLITKNIVIAEGGTPNIPFFVKRHENSHRIWHSAYYLKKIQSFKNNKAKPEHFIVIGGGQSAAEIVYDLVQSFPSAKVTMVIRKFGLKAVDESEFVNEIFSNKIKDQFFAASPAMRKKILKDHSDTNYSAVDLELIQKLYKVKYKNLIQNNNRFEIRSLATVEEVAEKENSVTVKIKNLMHNKKMETLESDAVILATGYLYSDLPSSLNSLSPYLTFDKSNKPLLTRHHRLVTQKNLKSGIYVQGHYENTFGLSETLLSLLPVRAKEILDNLLSYS